MTDRTELRRLAEACPMPCPDCWLIHPEGACDR